MDPEQTVLRVQARISGMLSQLLTPRIRTALEYIYLLVAVVLFAVLVFMHINFVQQTGCSSQLSGVQISEAQLFQIKITSVGLWCHIAADASMMKTENQGFLAKDLKNTAGFDILTNIPRFFQTLQLDHVITFVVQLIEKSSWEHDSTYLYITEKGYFLLSEDAKSLHNIRTNNVSISANSSCFGNRWQQLLINKFIGYDTILTNSLLSSPGSGYLYNFQTEEFYDLTYRPQSANVTARFGDYLVTKCSVLLMSLFVFFTTTMSVSFTLRETQSRMLKLTVQLQHHAHHHLPTFQLIFVHVIESLVFVPIMIGTLFFLFEFYNDQLLAFLILTLVWLCELFTTVSVRTPPSMQFFPRFFFLYFLMFHIYFFSYAHGFFYLAFSTTAAFMQHLILFFWNRYEVPALQRLMRNRSQFRQQTGVQITSTFLTSTLHIGRLNMRNPNIINSNLGAVPEPRLEPEQMESVDVSNSTTTNWRRL